MERYAAGALAGLGATALLSVLMLAKGAMGAMPDLDVIAMLAGFMGGGALMGWLAHGAIGVVYGLVFAALFDVPGTGQAIGRGALLGVAGWLVMMVLLMPMMGNGLFGLGLPSGMMIPVATLMLHLVFGAALGGFYAALRERRAGHV